MLNHEYRADERERQDVEYRYPETRTARAELLDLKSYLEHARQLMLDQRCADEAEPPPTGFRYVPPILHRDKREAREEKSKKHALVPAAWKRWYDPYDAIAYAIEECESRVVQARRFVENAAEETDDWNAPLAGRTSVRIERFLDALALALGTDGNGIRCSACVHQIEGCIADLARFIGELESRALSEGTPDMPPMPPELSPRVRRKQRPDASRDRRADGLVLLRVRTEASAWLAHPAVARIGVASIKRVAAMAREHTEEGMRRHRLEWERVKEILGAGRFRVRHGEVHEDDRGLRRDCTWVHVPGKFERALFCEERRAELSSRLLEEMDCVERQQAGTTTETPPPTGGTDTEFEDGPRDGARIAICPWNVPLRCPHPLGIKWKEFRQLPAGDRLALAYTILAALRDSRTLCDVIYSTEFKAGVSPLKDRDLLAKMTYEAFKPVLGADSCDVPELDPRQLSGALAEELLELVRADLSQRRLLKPDGRITSPAPRSSSGQGSTRAGAHALVERYFRENRDRYDDLLRRFDAGDPTASADREKWFGRNVLAKKLGITTPHLITSSPAWKSKGAILCQKERELAGKRIAPGRRIGVEIASEEKALEQEQARRRPSDLVTAIEGFDELPADQQEALAAQFEAGQMSKQQLQKIVATSRESQKDLAADSRRRR